MKNILLVGALFTFAFSFVQTAKSTDHKNYWIKVAAADKFQRSLIANTGAIIEIVKDDYVIAFGNEQHLEDIRKVARVVAFSDLNLEEKFRNDHGYKPMDFPSSDSSFHNYSELTAELQKLTRENPDLVHISSLAKTNENRDIWALRITKDLSIANQKPAAIYLGGHHAREHVSVEVPLKWAQYLISEYRKGNSRIINLVDSRDIHIIPAVNPDGLEYDVSGTKYKLWRKNRTQNSDGTYGVDINRNYGYMWGGGGASAKTTDENYRGPSAFSEIETQAVKNYIDQHTNITALISVHTFSKLILYPWGYSNDPLPIVNDRLVHEKMAQQMATWNGYKPEQSSDLYIASGDTVDWAYGVHKIISFTFELDPDSSAIGIGGLDDIFNSKCAGMYSPACKGFYPGQAVIDPTFTKNIEPFLYLLEYSDNPYRVLQQ